MNPILPDPNFILAVVSAGRIAFTAVFLLLLAGIVLIPKSLIGQEGGVPPWWRNVRIWAILICAVQILVYWTLG